VPPAFPPLDGSKVATGPVAAHIDTVLNGVTRNGVATAMVPWKSTLSVTDIAAVVTYERNAWGNHTGDAVQPSMVAAAKK
jgi:cytochrome c oxidase subunit 2